MSSDARSLVFSLLIVGATIAAVAWSVAWYNVRAIEYRGTNEAVLRSCVAACVGAPRP